jgi:hypothetical protein
MQETLSGEWNGGLKNVETLIADACDLHTQTLVLRNIAKILSAEALLLLMS